jgi:hypothetical protein
MILIVEPHPDDCCLSAFSFCKEFREEVALYSVFENDKRDSKIFCREMGIKHIEQKPAIQELIMKECKMKRQDLIKSSNSYLLQKEYYGEIYREKRKEVEDRIYSLCRELKPDKVITCLGIYHPFHVIVNMAVRSLYPKDPMFAEIPYISRKYGQKIYEDSRCSPEIIYEIDEETSRKKVEVFLKSYPTEKGMLRWDREVISHHSELILEGSEN